MEDSFRDSPLFSWLLPGETIEFMASGTIDILLTNAETCADNSENSMPAITATTTMAGLHSTESMLLFGSKHNAKKSKAQLPLGSVATFLSAAGKTLYGNYSQDSPSDIPMNNQNTHYIGSYQGSVRHNNNHHNRHFSFQDQQSKYPASSKQPSSQSVNEAFANNQCFMVTNFRICSLQNISEKNYIIRMQILIKSIATISYQEPSRINLTLKFDSPQYTLIQYFNAPRQPTMPEVMSSICRSLFNNEPDTRFQYQMGLSVINASISNMKPENCDPKKPRLWTAEDIFALPQKIQAIPEKGLHDDSIQLRDLLGWNNGYRISDEFKRLRFNDNLWSIVDLNERFKLSPTYAEHFIIPKGLLGSGGGIKHGNNTSRSDSVKMFMKQLVAFRASQRFPIISWKSPEGGLVIMRSSQPMVGFMGTRGAEDEMYVRTVLNTAAKECRRPNVTPILAPKLCIIDARSYSSAIANGCRGGGRENPDNYPNAKISFMSLDNIHSIESSHQSLLKAVSTQAESSGWHKAVESSGWLNHVTDLLKATSGRDGIVRKMIDENYSVLVHCTDGWDRTTQLVSLSQILLDPYYRTIKGLRVLIEKEWLSCGHPFQARTDTPTSQKITGSQFVDNDAADHTRSPLSNVHSSPNGAKEWIFAPRTTAFNQFDSKFSQSSTRATYPPLPHPHPTTTAPVQQPKNLPVNNISVNPSPIFLLFLTCLHHIIQQHPGEFEYNDYLLIILARAASGASPFGDFLYNNECEREKYGLRQRTCSIWKWIEENKGWFKNHSYMADVAPDPAQDDDYSNSYWRERVLTVQTGGRFISIWTEYYFNTIATWHPNPRTVISATLFNPFCKNRSQLTDLRRQVNLFTDPWYSSQFDPEQLRKLIYLGLHSNRGHQYQLQSAADETSRIAFLNIIPPVLAMLNGEDMHLCYQLVQHLRKKRRHQAHQAFSKWRSWTKRRLEEKPAREAGWVGISVCDSQEDSAQDHDSDDGYNRNRVPEFRVVAAKKGVETVISKILNDGPFFGKDTAVDEASSEDEDSIEASSERLKGEIESEIDIEILQDSFDEPYDDFGFPVSDEFVAV